MNKLQITIAMFGLLATSLLFFSCNDDDFVRPTGKDGRPSLFYMDDGETIGLVYRDGRLSETKKQDGSNTQFGYEGRFLKSISINPPRDVADGHAYTSFFPEKKNKIKVSSSGEPSFHEARYEIELDEQGRAAKISFLGFFAPNSADIVAVPSTYSLISYDEAGNLTKIESFQTKDGLHYRTCTYQYDQSKGSMSQSGLPSWYAAYHANRYATFTELAAWQFLNIHNNVTEISIRNVPDTNPSVIHIDYTYNKDDYPTSAFTNEPEKGRIDIRY